MPTLTIADMMQAYAEDAVDAAMQNFGIRLDYSFESIRELESILAQQHDAIPKGWRKMFQRAPSPETIETFAKMWGGYLGEVLRRRRGGEWKVPDDGPFKGALCVTRGDSIVSPPAKVFKRLTNGPEDDVWYYAKVFDERFAK